MRDDRSQLARGAVAYPRAPNGRCRVAKRNAASDPLVCRVQLNSLNSAPVSPTGAFSLLASMQIAVLAGQGICDRPTYGRTI
jgi:hypothetical protein